MNKAQTVLRAYSGNKEARLALCFNPPKLEEGESVWDDDATLNEWIEGLPSLVEAAGMRTCAKCEGEPKKLASMTHGMRKVTREYVYCEFCQRSGEVSDPHAVLRVMLAAAKAGLPAWERQHGVVFEKGTDRLLSIQHPGTRAGPHSFLWTRRRAIAVCDAYLKDPTKEKQAACDKIASNDGSDEGPWNARPWISSPLLMAAGFRGEMWEGLVPEGLRNVAQLIGFEELRRAVAETEWPT